MRPLSMLSSVDMLMAKLARPMVKYVIGPLGSLLTLADLPAPGTKRWVMRRKAEAVTAVLGGLLSLEEACRRYRLTNEEFLGWQYAAESTRLGLSAHHPHSAI